MAPGEGWTHHGCGEFSGVNETSLLREAEFTHAPSLQASDRMAGTGREGKVENLEEQS
jgi:hypothetical protein